VVVCPPTEDLARAVVDEVLNSGQGLWGEFGKVVALGEVLPQHLVRVLVGSAAPRPGRLSEVHTLGEVVRDQGRAVRSPILGPGHDVQNKRYMAISGGRSPDLRSELSVSSSSIKFHYPT